ncbi:MAG: hypothetical protein ACKVS8_14120 [Phycisphaerales bacterium]
MTQLSRRSLTLLFASGTLFGTVACGLLLLGHLVGHNGQFAPPAARLSESRTPVGLAWIRSESSGTTRRWLRLRVNAPKRVLLGVIVYTDGGIGASPFIEDFAFLRDDPRRREAYERTRNAWSSTWHVQNEGLIGRVAHGQRLDVLLAQSTLRTREVGERRATEEELDATIDLPEGSPAKAQVYNQTTMRARDDFVFQPYPIETPKLLKSIRLIEVRLDGDEVLYFYPDELDTVKAS